jgi:hypothetical protein
MASKVQKITALTKYLPVIRELMDGSSVGHVENRDSMKALSAAALELGIQAADLWLVSVADDRGNTSYGLGFYDVAPGNAGVLITVKAAMSREWIPLARNREIISSDNYADVAFPPGEGPEEQADA